MHPQPTSQRLLVVALLPGPAIAVRSAAAQVAVPTRPGPAPAAANPKSPGVTPFFSARGTARPLDVDVLVPD